MSLVSLKVKEGTLKDIKSLLSRYRAMYRYVVNEWKQPNYLVYMELDESNLDLGDRYAIAAGITAIKYREGRGIGSGEGQTKGLNTFPVKVDRKGFIVTNDIYLNDKIELEIEPGIYKIVKKIRSKGSMTSGGAQWILWRNVAWKNISRQVIMQINEERIRCEVLACEMYMGSKRRKAMEECRIEEVKSIRQVRRQEFLLVEK